MFRCRAIVTLLLCAATGLAETGAVLSGTGRVLVNDLETRSAALVSGDRILTGDEAFATIAEPGSTLVLAKKTSSTVDLRKLVLNQGHVSVTTASKYSVQAGPVTITPQATTAHYDVSRVACRITILAHDSALKLSDGTVVQPRRSVTRVEPNCAAEHTAPAAAYAPDAIAVGTAGIGGSALAAYLTSDGPKASPSRPRR